MKYSISLNFKYLLMKMNWENLIFHWEKWNFEPIGNSLHTTVYLALGKTLLTRLYLKVKVYITNLLSACHLQKIWCIKWNNLVWIFIFLGCLWPWKFTFSKYWMVFSSVLVSLMTYLTYIFFRCHYFDHN